MLACLSAVLDLPLENKMQERSFFLETFGPFFRRGPVYPEAATIRLLRQNPKERTPMMRNNKDTDEPLIPAHGGYRTLKSFIGAELVYDATVAFCNRFINIRSRTHDQTVQAARSGRQNIAEGSMASGTSKKTELKLVGVARASLEELLLDYEDFLRQRALPLFDKNHPFNREIRMMGRQADRTYETYRSYVEEAPPEIAANTAVCLIHQTNYLLDRQLSSLETAFVSQGGFSERLYRVRSAYRGSSGR